MALLTELEKTAKREGLQEKNQDFSFRRVKSEMHIRMQMQVANR